MAANVSSHYHVDLLVKEKRNLEEYENGDRHRQINNVISSPSSVLPPENGNGGIGLKLDINGGKGVTSNGGLSVSVPATPSLPPVISGWYADVSSLSPGEARFYEVEKVLFHGKSKYQELLVFQSKKHGKVAILDGSLQLTERDEFAYQEMLTHLPLCSIPHPKKVLLVGGGDGGILREISRHNSVEQIDICEIDEMIIDAYKKFFPDIAVGYKDPRVQVYIDNGIAFLKKIPEGTYDAIILDAFVEMGKHAVELADNDVLRSIAKALRPGGVVAIPSNNPWSIDSSMEAIILKCQNIFGGSVNYAWTTVPSYNKYNGTMGFLLCSTKGPKVDFKNPINPLNPNHFGVAEGPSKFYNSEIHAAAFCLPSFAKIATGSEVA
ncbi:hypothetical protein CDL15_Pgr014788 [Punica granatum]|uniref:PABS domain-containing protein n=1 Tax=Punica granatum TaxID=22663 RepID=A0A218XZG5_PUNGR|nr:hypothetical protein CDL15_Pgr014788 [Punica granatum]